MPKKKAQTAAPKKAAAAQTVRGPIYELKITLDDVKPPIWRRIQTADCTLADLHDLVQAAMGWHGGHLHLFEIGDVQFGLPEQWEEDDQGDSRKVKLSALVADGLKKARYVYDMGDNWQHTVLFEKVVEPEAGVAYPRCLDGKRACPPEDCGGAWGYAELLEALANPSHEQHDEFMEWCGPIDPEKFSPEKTNQALKALR